MKVNLINDIKKQYADALSEGKVEPDALFRRCIINWKKHFNLDDLQLAPTLENSLKNEVSGRYWGGEQHSIKSSLIALAKHNPELFWAAVKDLLNEDKMMIMRASRFIHHCDMIFQDFRKDHKKVNTHRQDYYSVSLLLSLENPEKYCLFEYKVFEVFCKRIEVNQVPTNTDLERYYKIIRGVYNVISRDEDFMNLYYSKLEPGIYYGPSLDLVSDLMHFSKY